MTDKTRDEIVAHLRFCGYNRVGQHWLLQAADMLEADVRIEAGHISETSETRRAYALTDEMSKQLETMRSELFAALIDANRYRWLRGNHNRGVSYDLQWHLPRGRPLNSEGLDADIDLAIKG